VLAEVCQDENYPEVIYFPQSALVSLNLSASDKRSFCPIKGYASYWSYQDPLAGVIQIKNHFAFDKDQGFRIILKK
jgi:uncharacterized protein (DUF427 family)